MHGSACSSGSIADESESGVRMQLRSTRGSLNTYDAVVAPPSMARTGMGGDDAHACSTHAAGVDCTTRAMADQRSTTDPAAGTLDSYSS